MAILRWDAVAAPNLPDVSEAYLRVGEALDKSLGKLSDGLSNMQQKRKDGAAGLLAARASGFTDVNQYNNALADGSILAGIDPSLLDAQTYAALDQRRTDLLGVDKLKSGIALDNDQLKTNQFSRENTKRMTDHTIDLDGKKLAQEDTKIQDARINNAGQLLNEQNKTSIESRKADSQIRGNNQAYAQSEANFNRAQLSLAQQDKIVGYTQYIAGAYDDRGRQDRLNEVRRNETDPYVLAGIGAGSNNVGQPGGGVANLTKTIADGNISTKSGAKVPPALADPNFGTSKGNPYNTVVGFGQYGNTGKPLVESTLGELQEEGKKLIASTKGTSIMAPRFRTGSGNEKGTSAMGLFQITNETREMYGKKLYGDDWKNTKFTPEVQNEMGKAIFDDLKNPLDAAGIWEGLGKAIDSGKLNPDVLRSGKWEDILPHIVDTETGVSGKTARAEFDAANNKAEQALAEKANTLTTQYAEAKLGGRGSTTIEDTFRASSQNPNDFPSVSKALQERLGITGENDVKNLNRVLTRLADVSKGETSLAVIADIIANETRGNPNGTVGSFLTDWLIPNSMDGGAKYINEDAASKAVKLASSGAGVQAALDREFQTEELSKAKAANDSVVTARNAWEDAVKSQEINGEFGASAKDIARYKEEYDKAVNLAKLANTAIENRYRNPDVGKTSPAVNGTGKLPASAERDPMYERGAPMIGSGIPATVRMFNELAR